MYVREKGAEDEDVWHCCQQCSKLPVEGEPVYKNKLPEDANLCSECQDHIDNANCIPPTQAG